MSRDHIRHAAEAGALRALDRDLRQVDRLRERKLVPDLEPLVRAVEEPTCAGGRRVQEREWRHQLGVPRGRDDRVEREVAGAEPAGVDQDLDLAVPLTPDRDVRDARDTEQPRHDRPARQDRQVDW